MSLVKVIVPCYRYAHFLRECVESILTQPEVDVRVLVIDDASPDDTPEVARGLVAQDPRVDYRRHSRNRGHIATYNEGLEWATDGDYAVLISADDLLTPGALRRATRLMDAEPEVGLVYGDVVKFETDKPRPQPRIPTGATEYEVVSGANWLRTSCSAGTPGIYSPEVVVRASLQRQLGGYRAELPHTADMEMWMRFAAHGAMGKVLNADQAFYRFHAVNMHSQRFSRLQRLQQEKSAFDLLFQEHGERIPDRARLQHLATYRLACNALPEISKAYLRELVSLTGSETVARLARGVYRNSYVDVRPARELGLRYARRLMGPRLSSWVLSALMRC